MPQPLSKTPFTGPIIFGGDTITQRPGLAALVMHTISMCSQIEAILGGLLTSLLGARPLVALSMYTALTSTSAQSAALRAAAASALENDSDGLNMLNAALSVVSATRKQRDKFSHHLWGIVSEPVDSLLLQDPRSRFRGEAAAVELKTSMNEAARGMTKEEWLKHTEDMTPKHSRMDEVYVYQKTELETIAYQASVDAALIGKASAFVSSGPSVFRERIRPSLFQDSRLEAAFRKAEGKGGPQSPLE